MADDLEDEDLLLALTAAEAYIEPDAGTSAPPASAGRTAAVSGEKRKRDQMSGSGSAATTTAAPMRHDGIRAAASAAARPATAPAPAATTSVAATAAAVGRPLAAGEDDDHVEQFSGLRIRNRVMSAIELRTALLGRTVHRIQALARGAHQQFQACSSPLASGGGSASKGGKEVVSWFTIGVLGEKSAPKMAAVSSARRENDSHLRGGGGGGGFDGDDDLYGDGSTTSTRFGTGVERGARGLSGTGAGGSKYMIWTLSDYGSVVTLFLFGQAYEAYWKEPEGTIWLVACPVLLPARERTTFSLSVSSPQQLLKLGTSPVYGRCKGTKKATGALCGKAVDTSKCPYCVYHMGDEYRKQMAIVRNGRPDVTASTVSQRIVPATASGKALARPAELIRAGISAGNEGGEATAAAIAARSRAAAASGSVAAAAGAGVLPSSLTGQPVPMSATAQALAKVLARKTAEAAGGAGDVASGGSAAKPPSALSATAAALTSQGLRPASAVVLPRNVSEGRYGPEAAALLQKQAAGGSKALLPSSQMVPKTLADRATAVVATAAARPPTASAAPASLATVPRKPASNGSSSGTGSSKAGGRYGVGLDVHYASGYAADMDGYGYSDDGAASATADSFGAAAVSKGSGGGAGSSFRETAFRLGDGASTLQLTSSQRSAKGTGAAGAATTGPLNMASVSASAKERMLAAATGGRADASATLTAAAAVAASSKGPTSGPAAAQPNVASDGNASSLSSVSSRLSQGQRIMASLVTGVHLRRPVDDVEKLALAKASAQSTVPSSASAARPTLVGAKDTSGARPTQPTPAPAAVGTMHSRASAPAAPAIGRPVAGAKSSSADDIVASARKEAQDELLLASLQQSRSRAPVNPPSRSAAATAALAAASPEAAFAHALGGPQRVADRCTPVQGAGIRAQVAAAFAGGPGGALAGIGGGGTRVSMPRVDDARVPDETSDYALPMPGVVASKSAAGGPVAGRRSGKAASDVLGALFDGGDLEGPDGSSSLLDSVMAPAKPRPTAATASSPVDDDAAAAAAAADGLFEGIDPSEFFDFNCDDQQPATPDIVAAAGGDGAVAGAASPTEDELDDADANRPDAGTLHGHEGGDAGDGDCCGDDADSIGDLDIVGDDFCAGNDEEGEASPSAPQRARSDSSGDLDIVDGADDAGADAEADDGQVSAEPAAKRRRIDTDTSGDQRPLAASAQRRPISKHASHAAPSSSSSALSSALRLTSIVRAEDDRVASTQESYDPLTALLTMPGKAAAASAKLGKASGEAPRSASNTDSRTTSAAVASPPAVAPDRRVAVAASSAATMEKPRKPIAAGVPAAPSGHVRTAAMAKGLLVRPQLPAPSQPSQAGGDDDPMVLLRRPRESLTFAERQAAELLKKTLQLKEAVRSSGGVAAAAPGLVAAAADAAAAKRTAAAVTAAAAAARAAAPLQMLSRPGSVSGARATGGAKRNAAPVSRLALALGVEAIEVGSDKAAALLASSTAHGDEAREAIMSNIMDRMDAGIKVEEMQAKMKEVTIREVVRFHCAECDKWYEKLPEMCKHEGHAITTAKRKQWRFECQHCRNKTYSYTATCTAACIKCGHHTWKASSIYNIARDSDTLATTALLLPTGEKVENSLRTGGLMRVGYDT